MIAILTLPHPSKGYKIAFETPFRINTVDAPRHPPEIAEIHQLPTPASNPAPGNRITSAASSATSRPRASRAMPLANPIVRTPKIGHKRNQSPPVPSKSYSASPRPKVPPLQQKCSV